MKKVLLTLAALTLTAFAHAQPGNRPADRQGPPPGGPRRGPPPSAVIRALDTDRNRELSAAEIAAAPASLRTLDANNDGSLSADELRPKPPADAPQRPADAPARPAGERSQPFDPIMRALDANQDGALSSTEIDNGTASIAALDLNKDGKLTDDEFRPLPPEGARPPRK